MKNVLLIEDSKASQTLMKMAFKTAELPSVLHIVENGDEAILFLKKRGKHASAPDADLVLLDLNLPGKSGIEILAEIHKDETLKNPPIVVLTGSNASADIQACAKFPKCRYAIKPSRFPELVELVKGFNETA